MDRTLSTAEVSRILGLGESRVRKMVRAGLCRPARRKGRAYGFSFQDLVVLRTAHGLVEQHVPPARVKRALEALEKELPRGQTVSGLRIFADGRRVAVRDGKTAWEPETGQTVLDFGLDDLKRKVETLARVGGKASDGRAPSPGEKAQAEFDRAVEIEDADPAAAITAYRAAVELDPRHADAHVNLGRLLHEAGRPADALAAYEKAVELAPNDAVAHFNLGLALEDTKGSKAAERAYERALAIDASFADAHWNLAGICEEAGRKSDALRHYAAYRRLTQK